MHAETLETTVPGLYVAGVVVVGRHTSEIFIEIGRFRGKQIVASLRSGRELHEPLAQPRALC